MERDKKTRWGDMESAERKKPKWGDLENEEEEEEEGSSPKPTVFETHPDENGVRYRTVVEWVDMDGKRVKITRKFKVYRKQLKISKKVLARRKWKKFGDCAGLPPGLEAGVTMLGEEVVIEKPRKLGEKRQEQVKGGTDFSDMLERLKQRRLQGSKEGSKDQWSEKAKKFSAESWDEVVRKDGEGEEEESKSALSGSGKSSYVPPHLRDKKSRGGEDSEEGGRGRYTRDDTTTVRVTNLSEDTTESDLQELFRPFGPLQRIYLSKDKSTGLSKGFAFVSYHYREDAATAIKTLNGHGYDHLILHLEWAKPSKRDIPS